MVCPCLSQRTRPAFLSSLMWWEIVDRDISKLLATPHTVGLNSSSSFALPRPFRMFSKMARRVSLERALNAAATHFVSLNGFFRAPVFAMCFTPICSDVHKFIEISFIQFNPSCQFRIKEEKIVPDQQVPCLISCMMFASAMESTGASWGSPWNSRYARATLETMRSGSVQPA